MERPNIDETIKRIEGMTYDLSLLPKKIELFAANEAKGIILVRIFTQGKDSEGNDIGVYDDKKKQTFLTKKAKFTQKQQAKLDKLKDPKGLTYKELRALKGLRTDKVDLQFSGKLFESIEIVDLGDRIVLGITDEQRADVAGYLEKKYGKDIFIIKGVEREELLKKVTLYSTQKFAEITQKWSQR